LAGIMRLLMKPRNRNLEPSCRRPRSWLAVLMRHSASRRLRPVAWVVATGFNIGVLERVVTVPVIAVPARARTRSSASVVAITLTAAQNGMPIRDRIADGGSPNPDTVIFD